MGPEIVTNNELYFMEDNGNGVYGTVIKCDGIKTINEARSEIGLDPIDDIVTITGNYSIELTGNFSVNDDGIIFDLIHPVKCNCRNCGAPVRLEYCEYCGTPYPTDYKLGMKFGGN